MFSSCSKRVCTNNENMNDGFHIDIWTLFGLLNLWTRILWSCLAFVSRIPYIEFNFNTCSKDSTLFMQFASYIYECRDHIFLFTPKNNIHTNMNKYESRLLLSKNFHIDSIQPCLHHIYEPWTTFYCGSKWFHIHFNWRLITMNKKVLFIFGSK